MEFGSLVIYENWIGQILMCTMNAYLDKNQLNLHNKSRVEKIKMKKKASSAICVKLEAC
jgi:hypothetical protein